MPEIDYSKTVIYKIKCKQSEIKPVFFGHTTSIYKCKYDIRNNCIKGKTGEMYDTIRANGGFDNWTITIMERYRECMTKPDAILRVEKFYKEENDKKSPPTSRQPTKKLPPNYHQKPPILTKTPAAKIHNFFCTNCGNKFTRNDSLMRHKKSRCKHTTPQNPPQTVVDILKQKLVEKEQEIDNLKKQMTLSSCQTNTHINNMNNMNNVNANSNNRTINNTIVNNNIIELGKEDLTNFFTEKQQVQILNRKHSSLRYYVELVHFNDKYPQFKNLKITNIHDGIAYKYSESKNAFVAVDKNELLIDTISCRMQDLRDFHENAVENKLITQDTADKLNKFFEQMETPDKQKQASKDVCFIIYNNRGKIDNAQK